jgi:hypothetical protein
MLTGDLEARRLTNVTGNIMELDGNLSVRNDKDKLL